MKNFLSLLKREFRLFWNNSVLRLLFFGAPILYGILIGALYQKGKVTDLPVIVVDMDQSSMSNKILEMINDNETIRIASIQHSEAQLSTQIIEQDAACVLMIPEGFEKKVLTRQNPELTTIVNTANVLTANYASGALQVILGTYKAGVQMEGLRKQGTPEALLLSQYEPFKTTFIKKNNRSTNYMYFLWPGVLITVLQQVILLGLALSFASEYENGTFRELTASSHSTLQMILVKVIPYLLMSLFIWILYGVMAHFLRMPFFEHIMALSLAAFLFVLAVSFMGILVSILLPSQLKATEVLMVVATPSFMLSGFTWPLSQMPVWLQWIAQVIPTTHFLPIFRTLIIENGTPDMTTIHLFKLLIIATTGFAASMVALQVKKKKFLKTTV